MVTEQNKFKFLKINNFFYIKFRKKYKFDKEQESLFQDHYYKSNINNIRIALIFAYILYNLFGILDYFVDRDNFFLYVFIRSIIVGPFILSAIFLSYTKMFKKIINQTLSFISIICGIGIIAIIIHSQSQYIQLMYYTGLIIVIFGIYTFLRMKLLYSIIAGWGIYLLYLIGILVLKENYFQNYSNAFFIGNNFFLISANIIGMFSNYYFELYSRRNFLQRIDIQLKNIELEAEKDELKFYQVKTINDLEMAKIIQEQIVPKKSQFNFIISYYKPTEQIGGDFFDFITFREREKIGIFIADVSGHGVASALITSMLKALIINMGDLRLDPAALLNKLNEILIDKTGNNFITAFYGILNKTTNEFLYSNAGHYPPSLIIDSNVEQLNTKKTTPLASFSNTFLQKTNKNFINESIILEKNSKLIFYTDGLIEIRSEDETVFFDSIIINILKKFSSKTLKECDQILQKAIYSFSKNEYIDDDICYILLEV